MVVPSSITDFELGPLSPLGDWRAKGPLHELISDLRVSVRRAAELVVTTAQMASYRACGSLGYEWQRKVIPLGFRRSVHWIPLDRIKWGYDRRPDRPPTFVADGDWDVVGKIPIRDFLAINSSCTAVTHIYRDMQPFDSCQQFAIMRDAILAGSFQDGWITRGCETLDEIVFYFNKLNSLHNDMRRRGFKTQRELGIPLGEEISVAVDRNGEFHKQEGEGNHRLAMASLLKIERVPVVVRRVHAAWVRKQMRKYQSDMLTAINLGFAEVVQAHPERDARG